ncbi:uncharacterized protein (DUF1501 family) [Paraburkholderia sp. MM5477-R1]
MLVKSPVEFVIGALRAFAVGYDDTAPFAAQIRALGENLFYPPNLSHFRSIEIWDTASRSDRYLRDGWLTRAFAMRPVPIGFAADGVVIGRAEMGPLANGARDRAGQSRARAYSRRRK